MQKVPVIFSRNAGRSNQTQPHAKRFVELEYRREQSLRGGRLRLDCVEPRLPSSRDSDCPQPNPRPSVLPKYAPLGTPDDASEILTRAQSHSLVAILERASSV
jgi:hypothetical protein